MPDESLSITSRYYILDDAKNPVPEPDVMRWATWFENADREIALTQIGGAEVSTVFLGMDHAWRSAIPLLYETMIFGGALDGEMDRYASRIDALKGHEEAVARVRGKLQ